MRIANDDGRLTIVDEFGSLDVERASGGQFSASPQAIYDRWEEFVHWSRSIDLVGAQGRSDQTPDPVRLGPPVPCPRQVFAVALNYHDHAAEIGLAIPEQPSVFTKFVSSFTGPVTDVPLPDAGATDWEVELVAVIGREAKDIAPEDGWDHVAGLTAAQDLSERNLQTAGPNPQFSLAKSYPGFTPMGPWLVTLDELHQPDAVAVRTILNGETVQEGTTANLIFPIPDLVARLSAVVTLYPGDVILTGTPAGVGAGRSPQRFLRPGDELVTQVEGIGELRQTMKMERRPAPPV